MGAVFTLFTGSENLTAVTAPSQCSGHFWLPRYWLLLSWQSFWLYDPSLLIPERHVLQTDNGQAEVSFYNFLIIKKQRIKQ